MYVRLQQNGWVGGGINYSVDERTKDRTRRLCMYEYGTAKELEGALWSTIRVDGLFRPRIVWARGGQKSDRIEDSEPGWVCVIRVETGDGWGLQRGVCTSERKRQIYPYFFSFSRCGQGLFALERIGVGGEGVS